MHDSPTQFEAWFGDSKAVRNVGGSSSRDAKWEPQVMYHTSRSDFQAFEVGRKTINTGTFGDWEVTRAAVFVTPDREASQAYGTVEGKYVEGMQVMPLYLRAEKPLDLTEGLTFEIEQQFESVGFHTPWLHNFDWSKFDDEDGRYFVEVAKRLGYDSVVYNDENPTDGSSFEAWAVFDPSQLKSALGNSGVFDRNSSDLTDRRIRLAQSALNFLETVDVKKAIPHA